MEASQTNSLNKHYAKIKGHCLSFGIKILIVTEVENKLAISILSNGNK